MGEFCRFISIQYSDDFEFVCIKEKMKQKTLLNRTNRGFLRFFFHISIYLFPYRFRMRNGFNILLARFRSGRNSKIPVMHALLRPFGLCYELLTVHTIVKYLMLIVVSIRQFLSKTNAKGNKNENIKKGIEKSWIIQFKNRFILCVGIICLSHRSFLPCLKRKKNEDIDDSLN